MKKLRNSVRYTHHCGTSAQFYSPLSPLLSDDWGNYEVIRANHLSGGQNLVSYSECDSTSQDTASTSTGDSVNNNNNNGNNGSRKRVRDNLSYESLSPEEKIKMQKQYKLTRPRIVKRDFRRDFPMLWINVTNTGSYDFMMEHINTFYHKDVILRQRDLRSCKRSFYVPRNIALTAYPYLHQYALHLSH